MLEQQPVGWRGCGERDENRGERENDVGGREFVGIPEWLGAVEVEAAGDGSDVVAPGDEVGEKEVDSGGGLGGSGAGAEEGDVQREAHGEVEVADGGVAGHEGLAGGEALVGVVGHAEIGLRRQSQAVRGVVAVQGGGARAVDGDDDDGAVGGDGGKGGDVVGGGDGGGVGVEEVGDGGGVVEGGDGSECKKREARGLGAVADESIGGVEVVVAVQLVVAHVALLRFNNNNYNYLFGIQ